MNKLIEFIKEEKRLKERDFRHTGPFSNGFISACNIILSFIKEDKNNWKYHECGSCSVLWPHLAVPEICVCGNDMKENYNKKTLKLVKFQKGRN